MDLDVSTRILNFNAKMKQPYEFKVKYAAARAREFADECNKRGLNYHVSVGGLDSITLLVFLRSLGIECPAISASYLEDKSIQKVHHELGVECIKPVIKEVRDDGTPVYWTKQMVIRDWGFPVLSKEISDKIEALQSPNTRNARWRHTILTGETVAKKGPVIDTKAKLSQKWLDLFGGSTAEGRALGYKAAPFKVSQKCCYFLKERPCELWANEHKSVPYLGLMASEGGRREKALKTNGCNYFGVKAIRSAPFAIFERQDLLQLALDLNVPVPEIYGEIKRDEDGILTTTGATRTGCSMCGYGIHLEKRPNRLDQLYERNPKEWEYIVHHLVQDENGEWYGWDRVLDYIGVDWRPLSETSQEHNDDIP